MIIALHTLFYILFVICGLVWVFSRNKYTEGGLIPISDRDIAWFVYIFVLVIVTLIYGGIFWW